MADSSKYVKGQKITVPCFQIAMNISQGPHGPQNSGMDFTGATSGEKVPLVANKSFGAITIIDTGYEPVTTDSKGNEHGAGYYVKFRVQGEDGYYLAAHLDEDSFTSSNDKYGNIAGAVVYPGEPFYGLKMGNSGHSVGPTGVHTHLTKYSNDGKKVPWEGSGAGSDSTAGPQKSTPAEIKEAMGAQDITEITGLEASTAGITADLFDPEGLDTEPWWEMGLVGNPHLSGATIPITFTMLLDDLNPGQLLRQKDGDPVELRLNCSLNTLSHQMKHVINKANSRTGFHITHWGMEPDVLTGSGSTGVFMNSFGVTSLMSLDGTLEELGLFDTAKSLYQRGGESDPPELKEDIAYANLKKVDQYWQSHQYVGYPQRDAKFNADWQESGSLRLLEDVPGEVIPSGPPVTAGSTGARMRVAAQDAFIELLSLFKSNGMVRFDSKQLGDRDQISPAVWSEQFGASVYERFSRNNDVMTKGSVLMTYKGNTYQGYFKSFNWTMDADSPFHWKFDFTFQVQKTMTYVYYSK